MKKTLIAFTLAAVLFSCKKETKDTEQTETQYLRIEEVDKDGSTTVSQIISVKVN